MPPLRGATGWLNSEPLGPADLQGRTVLVNFWTLTCINWLRTEPYVREWSRAYRNAGLVVVGVHTPEFSFEHDIDEVRRAVREREIDYPVAVDSDYAIWTAFDNQYWPALYFVDRDGVIRDEYFGEGRYARSERVIQELLGIDREPATVEGVGVEAEADWASLRTVETYLGSGNSRTFASPRDGTVSGPGAYEFPTYLHLSQWALSGAWTIEQDKVVLRRPGGSLAIRFQARDAHLVLAKGPAEPIPFRVFLDGDAPGLSHGVDVDEQGNGLLEHGRLYQLVRQRDTIGERILEVTFDDAGAEAYAFTFG
jgi:thiol-disulfide isomerase/thioredoxin